MDIDEWTSVQVETSFTLSANLRQLQVTCWLHAGSSTQRVQRSHQLRGQWRWSCMVDACPNTDKIQCRTYYDGDSIFKLHADLLCADESEPCTLCTQWVRLTGGWRGSPVGGERASEEPTKGRPATDDWRAVY